jgi:hypothetical protein
MRMILVFVLAYILALVAIVTLTGLPQTLSFAAIVLGTSAIVAAIVALEWRSSGSPWPRRRR